MQGSRACLCVHLPTLIRIRHLVSLSGAKVHYSTKQIQDLGDGISSAFFFKKKQRQQIDSKESKIMINILTVTTYGPAAMDVRKNVCTCRIWHRLNWKGYELLATCVLHIDGMLPRGRYTSSNECILGKPSIIKCRMYFSPILTDRSDSVERDSRESREREREKSGNPI